MMCCSERDEIELVDMSPHALRQRMKHGNVYRPDRTQIALEKFFTEANLTVTRELALRLVAQKVEGQLEDTIAGSSCRSLPSGCFRPGRRIPRLVARRSPCREAGWHHPRLLIAVVVRDARGRSPTVGDAIGPTRK